MSISSLRRRKLRTFLTVLGVVIGTASIVVMISLGLGLQQSMYEEVEQNGGTTSLTVTGKQGDGMSFISYGTYDSGSQEPSDKYITDEVIEQLRALEHVKSANPVLNISAIALKGKYAANLDLYGMTPQELESRNIELLPGRQPPETGQHGAGTCIRQYGPDDFYEENTGRGYWDSGELPDIDLAEDQLFLILDQDAYYASQSSPGMDMSAEGSSGAEGGSSGQVRAPKKYVVHASGVVAGGTEEYNANSYSVFCDLDTLRNCLQKEFRGRAIRDSPRRRAESPTNSLCIRRPACRQMIWIMWRNSLQ